MKRPKSNSAVEYATFNEIIKKSLFMYLCPDLMFLNTLKTNEGKDDLCVDSESLSYRCTGLVGMSMLESVRERKGLPESPAIGVCGCCCCWNEAWRENANLRSLTVPNPKSPFRELREESRGSIFGTRK